MSTIEPISLPVPVTILDHDARELGRQTARLLIDRLSAGGRSAPARLVEMPVRLTPALVV